MEWRTWCVVERGLERRVDSARVISEGERRRNVDARPRRLALASQLIPVNGSSNADAAVGHSGPVAVTKGIGFRARRLSDKDCFGQSPKIDEDSFGGRKTPARA